MLVTSFFCCFFFFTVGKKHMNILTLTDLDFVIQGSKQICQDHDLVANISITSGRLDFSMI